MRSPITPAGSNPLGADPQRAIRCVLMRGGTSRGPVFLASDLPPDRRRRDRVLLAVIGSPGADQVDGLGGATTVTSKVAIVSPSAHPEAEIDYRFAQVDTGRELVDTGPTCGNMLAAVGPFAVDEGLVTAGDPTTHLVVRDLNTGSLIDVEVPTPRGSVSYGEAPIELRFRQIVGAKTGSLLPTGRCREPIDGLDATCIDLATPMVLLPAAALGVTGTETPSEIDGDRALMARLEAVRRQAGRRMGLGDVARSVLPKVALLAPPRGDGHLSGRYLTPWRCHPSFAVSGSICVGGAALLPGTVAADVARGLGVDPLPSAVRLEHPTGWLDVDLDAVMTPDGLDVRSAGVRRTARRLMAGEVYVPDHVWP